MKGWGSVSELYFIYAQSKAKTTSEENWHALACCRHIDTKYNAHNRTIQTPLPLTIGKQYLG